MISALSALLKTGFRHGVHPPDHKDATAGLPTRRMPFPEEIVLPLRQHAGAPARLLVSVGQRVERGDKVGEAQGHVSVPIHTSASGTVSSVGWWPHPDGSQVEAVRIAVDPHSAQIPRPRLVPRWEGLQPDEVRAAMEIHFTEHARENIEAALLPIYLPREQDEPPPPIPPPGGDGRTPEQPFRA